MTNFRCVIAAIALFYPSYAFSCPANQYNQCVGPSIHSLGININPVCGCVPNGHAVTNGIVAAINPIPDTLNLFGAVAHGNIKLAYSSLGSLITKSSCVACAAALNTFASTNDKTAIEELVGRGWLVFVSDQPELLLVDAAGTQSQEVPLNPPPAPPIAIPVPARSQKNYIVTGANCAVVHATKQAVGGWVDPPTFVDIDSHTTATFPNVDLQPGDKISIVSNDECKITPSGDSHVTSTNIIFKYPTVVPGGATAMKYFLTGDTA